MALFAVAISTAWSSASFAESQGAYVHGALRKADRDVFYCHEPHVAVYVARLYNSLFAEGASTAEHVNATLNIDVGYLVKSGQCARAAEIDHTSLQTIMTAPPGNVVKRHVVKSRMVHSFSYIRINYVVTANKVPPCPAPCYQGP